MEVYYPSLIDHHVRAIALTHPQGWLGDEVKPRENNWLSCWGRIFLGRIVADVFGIPWSTWTASKESERNIHPILLRLFIKKRQSNSETLKQVLRQLTYWSPWEKGGKAGLSWEVPASGQTVLLRSHHNMRLDILMVVKVCSAGNWWALPWRNDYYNTMKDAGLLKDIGHAVRAKNEPPGARFEFGHACTYHGWIIFRGTMNRRRCIIIDR